MNWVCFLGGLIVGAIFGGIVGMFAACMCMAAGRENNDE